MSEMVERIAKALFEDQDKIALLTMFGTTVMSWEDYLRGVEQRKYVPIWAENFRRHARVMLTAAREPTAAMVAEGYSELCPEVSPPIRDIWAAMIDEAIR